MPDYKLDLSFSHEGTVQLHVFDLNADESGPLETCSVGEELDSYALGEAWEQFHDRE
ncbi:hypothetical protein [Candidatus Halobonum tyrrellensis]|uniref:hypothetical protein n=1 Tax=Candidatus Halobonum tyrrellensis TaxID=1431545 RepID=UPI0013781B1C|nr:hypothetical protein [Candidatus Halobonum tyrrellensis]